MAFPGPSGRAFRSAQARGDGKLQYNNGFGIAADGSGSLFVTGISSGSWDGALGQDPAHFYAGANDAFVLGLTDAGAYGWHTFYGSGDYDGGNAIATDGTGGIFATGYSYIPWLGPSDEEPIHAHSGGSIDLFVLALGI